MLGGPLLSLSVGTISTIEHGGKQVPTAFHKRPVAGPTFLGALGLRGDHQAYRHHGGPDKAVLVYPKQHYAYWSERFDLVLPDCAAFGENFTVEGLSESEVWVGDVFTIGDAVVQVTAPRAPCFKIGAVHGVAKMAVHVQERGYTGFLLRVLKEGPVASGQVLTLCQRAGHGVSVSEANRILNVDRWDLDGARRLLSIASLPENLKDHLRKRIAANGFGADVHRLFGTD